MQRSLRLAATAKVNLSLALGTRQADGFHAIDTVFHSLALHDDVRIDVAPGHGQVSIEVEGDAGVAADETNLAWRAAQVLLAGAPLDVHLRLVKRIPTGAGLGGGSADAAAVLIGLNSLLPDPLLDNQLLILAADLGCDVPFALRGGTARGRGRGQLLTALPPPPGWHFVLVQPPFAIATSWCYQEWSREAHALDPRPVQAMTAALREGEPRDMVAALYNDFEPVVFHRYPTLATIKQRLLGAGCFGALMTGSGSCLFGMTTSAAEAERVAAEVHDLPGRVVTTQSRDLASGLVTVG